MTEEGLLKLENWAKNGLIDKEIADKIGVNRKTLYEWQNRFPEMRNALKRGKETPDNQVENSLLRSALGYTTTETKIKKDGNGKIIEEVIITKEVPANPTSIIFWLKNRRPDLWREKKEIDHSLSANKEIDSLSESIIKLVKEEKDDKQ